MTATALYNVVAATASVTLTGLEFGRIDATVTSVLALADCSTSSWTAVTSVACIGLRGAGGVGTTGISVASVAGTSSNVFSFDGSLVFSVSQLRSRL